MGGLWKRSWWRALVVLLAATILLVTGFLYYSRDTPPPPRIIITKTSASYPLWTDTRGVSGLVCRARSCSG